LLFPFTEKKQVKKSNFSISTNWLKCFFVVLSLTPFAKVNAQCSTVISSSLPINSVATATTFTGSGASFNFTQSSAELASALTNYEYSTINGSTWTGVSPASTTNPLNISSLLGSSIMICALNNVDNSFPSNKYCALLTSITNVSIRSSDLQYISNGITYNTARIYTYTTSNTQSCDSVETLNLTVTPNNRAGGVTNAPTLCINKILTTIAHTTTEATGIANNNLRIIRNNITDFT